MKKIWMWKTQTEYEKCSFLWEHHFRSTTSQMTQCETSLYKTPTGSLTDYHREEKVQNDTLYKQTIFPLLYFNVPPYAKVEEVDDGIKIGWQCPWMELKIDTGEQQRHMVAVGPVLRDSTTTPNWGTDDDLLFLLFTCLN